MKKYRTSTSNQGTVAIEITNLRRWRARLHQLQYSILRFHRSYIFNQFYLFTRKREISMHKLIASLRTYRYVNDKIEMSVVIIILNIYSKAIAAFFVKCVQCNVHVEKI